MEWKLPPRAKVYEALSCVGSGHVEFTRPGEALVTSSEGDRKYRVIFDLEGNQISSDDNGSKWQGYLGYPSIAVLMLKGKLPFDKELSRALRDIKWNSLNRRYKRNYDLAIKEAQQIAMERGCEIAQLEQFVDRVMQEIEAKRFERLAPRRTRNRAATFPS